MRKAMVNWITSIWYPKPKQSPVERLFWACGFLCLAPIAVVYAVISLSIQYLSGFLQSMGYAYRSSVPVIVVGNFTVGGTGKTPLVAHLYEQLKQQGYHPGIISRGYGRKTSQTLVVTEALSCRIVGDEALLLSRLTQAPMVVSKHRNKAIDLLLSRFPLVDIIISDDGLQHAALQADVRIAVVDAIRQWGNGWCLPAGPLRAPGHMGRFSQADIVVLNKTRADLNNATSILQDLPCQKYNMYFKPLGFSKIIANTRYSHHAQTISINEFKQLAQKKRLHAIAGIGNPTKFFDALNDLGLSVVRHAYSDHHDFSVKDLTFQAADLIIMTEKDAIKCADLPFQGDCWVMKICVTMEAGFLETLLPLITKAQSSRRKQ